MNILLVNPGRRDYMVNFFLSLKKKYNLNIFLVDPDKNVPSFKVSTLTKNNVCPKVKNSKKFLSFLNKYVLKNKIDVIFPISDRELKILSQKKKFFMKKGVNVIVSDLKIIENCQNKIKFSKYLKKFNILCPKIITKKNIKKNLPVIKKEVNGSASKNQEVIFKSSQINKNYEKKFFFQKFLKYQEYNLDILNDLNGNYLHSCAKKKLFIRAGETDKAVMINNKVFENFAKKLSKALRHIGVVDIDFFYNKKKFYVLDINPRLGGGYPFTHLYGYDYIDKILSMVKNPNKKIIFSKKQKNSGVVFTKGISIYKH